MVLDLTSSLIYPTVIAFLAQLLVVYYENFPHTNLEKNRMRGIELSNCVWTLNYSVFNESIRDNFNSCLVGLNKWNGHYIRVGKTIETQSYFPFFLLNHVITVQL